MVTVELSRSSMRGMAFYSKVRIYGRRISGFIHRLVRELYCNKSSRRVLTFHSHINSCRIFYIISRWDKSSGRLMEFSTLMIQNQRASFQWCFLSCSPQCRNRSCLESKIEKSQKQPKHSSAKSNPGPSFDRFSYWLWWGWAGRIPGEGNGCPLQYSCLENPMDIRAWRATERLTDMHARTHARTHAHTSLTDRRVFSKVVLGNWTSKWTCMEQNPCTSRRLEKWILKWTDDVNIRIKLGDS